MNLKEFENDFDTKEKCLKYLSRLRLAEFCCKKCQHDKAWVTKLFKFKCKKCNTQKTVTDGTVFYDSRIPLNIWFRSIWCITSNEKKINAFWLQKELNLGSHHTASKLLQKLRQFTACCEEGKLQGTVEVYKDYVKINGGIAYVVMALEINGDRFRWINMKVIKDPTQNSVNAFIDSHIKRGSKLKYAIWNESLSKNYSRTFGSTKDTATEIFPDFINYIAERNIGSQDELAKHLKAYCIMNCKYNIKIAFQNLLQTFVTSNIDKINAKSKTPVEHKK